MEKATSNEILKDFPEQIEQGKIPDEDQPADQTVAQATIKAEIALETRIEQLKNSIQDARIAFKKASCKLLIQIGIWGVISAGIIIIAILYAKYLLNPENVKLPEIWTWQVIYYTLIRMTIIGAIFSFATYCFKLLSSHIQMYQYNEHKVAVINALPGFVESGIDPQKRDIIFNKLIEMVVHFDETGIIVKDKELKANYDTVIKLIEFMTKKDKEK